MDLGRAQVAVHSSFAFVVLDLVSLATISAARHALPLSAPPAFSPGHTAPQID